MPEFYVENLQQIKTVTLKQAEEFVPGHVGGLVRSPVDLSEYVAVAHPDVRTTGEYRSAQIMVFPGETTIKELVQSDPEELSPMEQRIWTEMLLGKDPSLAPFLKLHGNPYFEVIEVVDGSIWMFELPLVNVTDQEITPAFEGAYDVIKQLKPSRFKPEKGTLYTGPNPCTVNEARDRFIAQDPIALLVSSDPQSHEPGELVHNRSVYCANPGTVHGYRATAKGAIVRVILYDVPRTEDLEMLFRENEDPKTFRR